MEKPETKKKSLFKRIFGGEKSEVKKVDVKPVFVDEHQMTEPKPQITKLIPQMSESKPQMIESIPQKTNSKPQMTESKPHAESIPQMTDSKPQMAESKPQDAEQ